MKGEGNEGGRFSVCWDKYGLHLGERMKPCGDRTEDNGYGGGTLDDRRRGQGGSNK